MTEEKDEELTSEYLTQADPAEEAKKLRAPRSAKEAFGSSYHPPKDEQFPWWTLIFVLIVLLFLWGTK